MPSKWLEKLQNIPAFQSVGIIDVKPFAEGLSNQSMLVSTDRSQWVVRFNQQQIGINRKLEQQVLQLIEPLNICPKIIECNPANGYLISEYIPKPTWIRSTFNNKQQLARLKNQLDRVHQVPFNHLASRLDQRMMNYVQSLPVVPDDLHTTIIQQIEQLENLEFWQVCLYLCHYDLNPSNLLGNQPLIIDWEFAGQGHGLIDWLILEHETGHDLQHCYPRDINPDWIRPCKRLIQTLMALWQLNQSS